VNLPPQTRCNLTTPSHTLLPSAWVKRWLPIAPTGGRLLDWACGSGRHSLLGHGLGYQVTALDVQINVLKEANPEVEWRQADLENGDWSLGLGERFDAIVVTNYLFRPRLDLLLAHLAPAGLLIYETFALGNEAFGRPKNPAFLLRPTELFGLCARHHLHVLAYEDGITDTPARVQRVVARRLVDPEGTLSGANPLLLK
jgi:Tellurite resistance protein TehB